MHKPIEKIQYSLLIKITVIIKKQEKYGKKRNSRVYGYYRKKSKPCNPFFLYYIIWFTSMKKSDLKVDLLLHTKKKKRNLLKLSQQRSRRRMS